MCNTTVCDLYITRLNIILDIFFSHIFLANSSKVENINVKTILVPGSMDNQGYTDRNCS